MASTICPAQFEREMFGSAPDERDARGFIKCWVADCERLRWVDAESMVVKCLGCGDEAYEYDVSGDASEEFEAKAKVFRESRKR